MSSRYANPPPCVFEPERAGDVLCRWCGETREQHEAEEIEDSERRRRGLAPARLTPAQARAAHRELNMTQDQRDQLYRKRANRA